MKKLTLCLLGAIYFISCNPGERGKNGISQTDTNSNNPIDNPFVGHEVVDSASILDTLAKHASSEYYQTSFIETGHLISRFYQGRVNGQGFGITVNLNDGVITVYSNKHGTWQVTDRIDEDNCLEFKLVKTDLNNDGYKDITLICPDDYHRMAFLFNPAKNIIEHARRYDRKERND